MEKWMEISRYRLTKFHITRNKSVVRKKYENIFSSKRSRNQKMQSRGVAVILKKMQ